MGTIKRTFANNLTSAGKINSTNLDSVVPASNIANSSVTNVTEVSPSIGAAIKGVAGNPPSPSQTLGDMWYDTNLGTLKNVGQGTASWASGASLPATRQNGGQAGLQTAAVFAGGQTPGTYNNNNTYLYDGSSWTSGNNLGTARRSATMMGTQTAALLASSGINNPLTATTATEEWDGTNWTSGGAQNTARYGSFSGGTQTQAVIAGGSGPSVYYDDTEEYNGSSWTTATLMPGNQGNGTSGSDTQTDMYCVAGGPGNKTTSVVYDGTNWTSGASLSGDGRRGTGGAMPSSSSPGFVCAGETATVNPVTITEEWNGTSFSSSTAIPAAHRDPGNGDGGTGEAGLVSGGHSSTAISSSVFEWTGTQQTVKTVTTST